MKTFLMGSILLFAANSYAQDLPYEVGDITFLQIHKNPDNSSSGGQRFTVRLDGSASANSCGADQWTGYLDSDAGKAQYSAILSSVMANKKIKLQGTASDRCESGSLLLRNVYVVW